MYEHQAQAMFGAAKHKFNVVTNSVFLRRDARLKKRDSNRHKAASSFNFETVQELYHLQSWREFVRHPAAPMATCIGFLCMFLTAIVLSKTFSDRIELWRQAYADPMALYRVDHFDRKVMVEVHDALTTAMHLEHKGNIKEYITFLDDIIPKYCLDYVNKDKFVLDVVGNENFHLNLKSSIRFVAKGGTFAEHKMMAIYPDGTIIDPTIEEMNAHNVAEPCPLLTGLWEMGIPTSEERAKDHMFRQSVPQDNVHAFDRFVRSYHVDNFYLLASAYFLSGDCKEGVTMLEKNVLKNVIMKWIDVVQQSAMDTEKYRESEGERTFAEPHHWVIDTSNGDVLPFEGKLMDPRRHISCWGIRSAFNTQWTYDDDPQQKYTTDTVRKHVEDYFDTWYTEVVHQTNVQDGKA